MRQQQANTVPDSTAPASPMSTHNLSCFDANSPRPFILSTLDTMPHRYIWHEINSSDEWGVFERRFSTKWLLVAKCPDERCAETIVAHMNASVGHLAHRGWPGGATCVAICSLDAPCDDCGGKGLIRNNNREELCPKAKELYENFHLMEEFGSEE